MAYTVTLTRRAAEALAALPSKVQKQIATRIDGLSNNPRPPGSKQLAAEDGIHRLRSGDYRVLYRIDDPARTVLVLVIGNRRDVYRNR